MVSAGARLGGAGLVTEGAGALVDGAFRELGLRRVWASCLPDNPASARVLEKLGFRREGAPRDEAPRDGWRYALGAAEWRGAPPDRRFAP